MRLHPFRAIRPKPELAAQVAAVPYDVVNRAEAAELARGNPHSFLHVGRSDIDLPEDVDPYDPRIYAGAARGPRPVPGPGHAAPRPGAGALPLPQMMDGRAQTGVVGCVHIDDYEQRHHPEAREDPAGQGRRPHPPRAHAQRERGAGVPDLPRPAGHRRADGGGPCARRRSTTSPRRTASGTPSGGSPIRRASCRPSAQVPHAYVADGHHRSASAWRAGKELRAKHPARHRATTSTTGSWPCSFRPSSCASCPYNRRGEGPERAERRRRAGASRLGSAR